MPYGRGNPLELSLPSNWFRSVVGTLSLRESGNKREGDRNQGKTAEQEAMEAERAAAVRKDREIRGFDWSGFFSNRYILLQILLYAYLFYANLPGLDEVGPLLVWLLLLLPMCVLNLIGTHKLKELAERHQRQD